MYLFFRSYPFKQSDQSKKIYKLAFHLLYLVLKKRGIYVIIILYDFCRTALGALALEEI